MSSECAVVETNAASAAAGMDAMWGQGATGRRAGDPRLQWFLDEKYSMFIHWGLYSHLGGDWQGRTYHGIGEWIMHSVMADIPVDAYKAVAREFNPVRFDARAIVGLAAAAGMRGIVITAKHHEGFAMFDSKASDFTIVRATPFGRDPMRELADACHAAGIRLGFYYSQFQDWTEPDGGGSRCPPVPGRTQDFDRYFDGKVVPQIVELLTGYGPISVVWFDTPGNMGSDYSRRLVDLVRKHQPDCLVNSRVGNGLGDYSSLGDMEIPAKTPTDNGVYECIDTTNDSWAYARCDTHWKSPVTIAQSLVRVIARGCSFMLNVGPRGDGAIPEDAVLGLRGAGEWVHTHKDAIYGTTGSPFPPFAWGDCTARGQCLYLHIFDWPRTGRLQLAALSGRVCNADLLRTGQSVPFTQADDLLTLDLAAVAPDPLISVIRLTLASPPAALHQDLTLDGQFPAHLRAEYATIAGVALEQTRWMETFGEWKKSENLTRWQGTGAHASWALNVLRPGPYSLTVEYACDLAAEGAEWQIEAASDRLVFVALDTGMRAASDRDRRPRMRYRAVEKGVLHLARPGRQTLRLSPRGAVQGQGIWVTQLTLMPWV